MVVILCADGRVYIFVFFGALTRHPAQGATGGFVMPALVFKWFLWSEFSLITPRVSSLVVYGLGVSDPSPKTQGFISSTHLIRISKMDLRGWFFTWILKLLSFILLLCALPSFTYS